MVEIGIIDDIIERVGIIKIACVVKGTAVTKRVGSFPDAGLQHFPVFVAIWKFVESMQRIQRIQRIRWYRSVN